MAFFPKIIFLRKKKKKIFQPPHWPQLRPPTGLEIHFFLGWPKLLITYVLICVVTTHSVHTTTSCECDTWHVRLSIKIILFPVEQPRGSKRCDWRLFFSFFSKNGQYFPTKKKIKWEKKKIAAARLASIFATHWTGNTFFMDSLRH